MKAPRWVPASGKGSRADEAPEPRCTGPVGVTRLSWVERGSHEAPLEAADQGEGWAAQVPTTLPPGVAEAPRGRSP